jgi:hypothetical protein
MAKSKIKANAHKKNKHDIGAKANPSKARPAQIMPAKAKPAIHRQIPSHGMPRAVAVFPRIPSKIISPPPIPPPSAKPPSAFAGILSNKWLTSPVRLFALLAFLWLIGIFIYAFLAPPVQWSFTFKEQPLVQVSSLAMVPGDSLQYAISNGNFTWNASIIADDAVGCNGLFMYDRNFVSTASALSRAGVCIGPHGEQLGADGKEMGSNVSYENISWPYFAPWMLAVDDNWSWSAEASFSAGPFDSLSTQVYRYSSLGHENYLGRDAFSVALSSQNQPGEAYYEVSRMLVDSKKRVLLSMKMGNMTVRLYNASFLESN